MYRNKVIFKSSLWVLDYPVYTRCIYIYMYVRMIIMLSAFITRVSPSISCGSLPPTHRLWLHICRKWRTTRPTPKALGWEMDGSTGGLYLVFHGIFRHFWYQTTGSNIGLVIGVCVWSYFWRFFLHVSQTTRHILTTSNYCCQVVFSGILEKAWSD